MVEETDERLGFLAADDDPHWMERMTDDFVRVILKMKDEFKEAFLKAGGIPAYQEARDNVQTLLEFRQNPYKQMDDADEVQGEKGKAAYLADMEKLQKAFDEGGLDGLRNAT